jgi:hypothetical protein
VFKPVLEKIHMEMLVELRRQRPPKARGRAMSVRRKHYKMTAMFGDGARIPKKAVDPSPASAYFMLTESARGVLGGNHIYNSWTAMGITMNPSICEAIRERRVVRFRYGGGYRLVEPHCYGVSRDGKELLRGYQISGHSECGQSEGWKLFRLNDVSDLGVTNDSLKGPRTLYNPNDKAMAAVYCCL